MILDINSIKDLDTIEGDKVSTILDNFVTSALSCLGFKPDGYLDSTIIFPAESSSIINHKDERKSQIADGTNGKLSPTSLKSIGEGNHKLTPAAANAYMLMKEAAAKDGVNLVVTDSYRSYEAQVDVYKRKPDLAAKPGTSNHGLGLAIDVNLSANPKIKRWLDLNAYRFGWENPEWAKRRSRYEPWHWEFKL